MDKKDIKINIKKTAMAIISLIIMVGLLYAVESYANKKKEAQKKDPDKLWTVKEDKEEIKETTKSSQDNTTQIVKKETLNIIKGQDGSDIGIEASLCGELTITNVNQYMQDIEDYEGNIKTVFVVDITYKYTNSGGDENMNIRPEIFDFIAFQNGIEKEIYNDGDDWEKLVQHDQSCELYQKIYADDFNHPVQLDITTYYTSEPIALTINLQPLDLSTVS